MKQGIYAWRIRLQYKAGTEFVINRKKTKSSKDTWTFYVTASEFLRIIGSLYNAERDRRIRAALRGGHATAPKFVKEP